MEDWAPTTYLIMDPLPGNEPRCRGIGAVGETSKCPEQIGSRTD